jgi:NADP-dependent 3-hydroxy acid dehydrogenase YdfG
MSKTILITGASSGFGRLTAEKLARSGHAVFAGFRSFAGPKKQVADELKSQKIEVLELDVTSDKKCQCSCVTPPRKIEWRTGRRNQQRWNCFSRSVGDVYARAGTGAV